MGVIDGLCSTPSKGTISTESRDFKAVWLPKPLRSLREGRGVWWDLLDHNKLARRATLPTTDLDWFCRLSRAAFRRCRSASSHWRRCCNYITIGIESEKDFQPWCLPLLFYASQSHPRWQVGMFLPPHHRLMFPHYGQNQHNAPPPPLISLCLSSAVYFRCHRSGCVWPMC